MRTTVLERPGSRFSQPIKGLWFKFEFLGPGLASRPGMTAVDLRVALLSDFRG